MDKQYYTDNPYGSPVALATERQAKALTKGLAPAARIGDSVLRFPDQEPCIIFGGAASGKFSTLGAYPLVHPTTDSFFVLDVGGQYMSTTYHWNLAEKREAYAINPSSIGAYPDTSHAVNLWGILKNDEFLFENAKRIMDMGITGHDNEGENAWVGSAAKRFGCRILIALTVLDGNVNPASFWETLNKIEESAEYLKALGRETKGFPFDTHSTFVQMYTKKTKSEKEWSAIFSCMLESFDWLSDPKVAASVSGEDDYLSALADPTKKVGIYYVIPGGSGKTNESLTRMVVGIAQLHCVRAGLGARPLFYLEEAATCGGAEFIKSAVSEFRKYFRTVLVYQSYGQLVHHFKREGAQEVMDSAGMQLYLVGGIRDIDSAKRLADTVGKTTIHIDDPMAQADRQHRADKTMFEALKQGLDPLSALSTYKHERNQSTQQRKTGRYAIDPAEILKLKDEILVVSPGSGVSPVLATKLPPYWTNPAMAGRYGPDPLFPPLDRITTQGRFFKRTRRFIREDVPDSLAHWPQHSNGQIAYVQGYKTW